MSALTTVGYFLVTLLFGLIIFSLWVRIALRYFCVSTLNPLSQLIYTLTDSFLRPFYIAFHSIYKSHLRYDWLAFIGLVAVEVLKIICIGLLAFHTVVPIVVIIIYVLADLVIQPCDLLFYAILIRVIMSYVNPAWNHPIADFLRIITEPSLRLGRRVIPVISGFDFSPIVIMIVLKVITLFISASLPWHLI